MFRIEKEPNKLRSGTYSVYLLEEYGGEWILLHLGFKSLKTANKFIYKFKEEYLKTKKED